MKSNESKKSWLREHVKMEAYKRAFEELHAYLMAEYRNPKLDQKVASETFWRLQEELSKLDQI